MAVICVKMRFHAVAANVNDWFAQTLCKTSFPISPGVVIREISNKKATAAYLIFNDRIDVPRLLRDRSKIIARLLDGWL